MRYPGTLGVVVICLGVLIVARLFFVAARQFARDRAAIRERQRQDGKR